MVDDDREIRDLFEMLLSDEGYRTVTAIDGVAALQVAVEEHLNLILLDLMLPRLDGVGFCRAYREHGGGAPVILITAAAPDYVASVSQDCGAAAYIAKPFDVDQVLRTVAMLHVKS